MRLHNEDWDYETNCFVCEPKNGAGLQIPFFHDVVGERVIADFTLGDAFSGAPTLVHGGVSLAILDEAMAWACIAVGRRWAMTAETTTRFERPVMIDRPYRVEAWIVAHDDALIRTKATIAFSADGAFSANSDAKVCAAAEASFTVVGEAQVTRLTGDESPDTDYTR